MTVEPNDTEDDVAHMVRSKDRPAAGSSWGHCGLLSLRENANVLPPFIPNSIQRTLRGAEQGSGSGGSNPGEGFRAHLG